MDCRIEKFEEELAREVLAMASRAGAQKSRVTLNKSVMDLVATLNGEVDKVTHSLDRSLSITLFVDGRYGTFSTNKLERTALEEFVGKAVGMTRMLAEDRFRDLPSPERKAKDAQTGLELGLYDPAYEEVTPEMRRSTAVRCSAFDGRMISEEGEYSDTGFDSIVMDSEGLYARHTESAFEYGVEVTIQDKDGNRYSAYDWESSPALKDFHPEGCGEKALEKALAQVGMAPEASGRYNMVLDRDVASKVVTPVLNALAGSAVQQNNSFLTGMVGKKVFPEGLTIIDDCHLAGESGSRLYDSEGVATSDGPIIEKGVISKYFLNTYMAAKMEMEPTIEDSTRAHVLPWPEKGLDRDAIMKLCGDGILVTGFNGGNSNSATGDFSYGIEGFLFKDGKIVKPVSEMLVTGNFLKLWENLIAAGDDPRRSMSKLIPTLAFSKVDFSG